MTKPEPSTGARNRLIAILVLSVGCLLLILLILGILAVRVWDYTNSVAFCSTTCHDVHPEEPVAFQDSYHARVKCTECHMGRVSTLRAIGLKSTHARHLPAVLLGQYGRPLESESMRPANETCERCHSPTTAHDDAAREIRRFLPDQSNSEKRTYLLLKTGTGAKSASQGYGIHWHISNQVEYIATDDHKQEIRWVRATLPDGRTVEYKDVLSPLSPEEISRAEKRRMDCVDCHNRIGHPYRPPDKLIDEALVDGRLSPALPYAKKELSELLAADYAGQVEALAAVDSLRTRYQEAYPEAALAYGAEIDQAVQLARELIPRLVFEEPGVTWQSFSDNIGHQTSPGCFRCHDGKHLSQEGESIPLKCGLCHSIPMTVDAGDGPPEMPIASREEPPSHLETSFVSDHRFAANDACVDCHGAIAFGEDDSSFCANSACHGMAWPMVDLDAIFTHPVRLTGGHTSVQCYRCHNGVSDISYECANCHTPPAEPHYGVACQDCHIANGFQLASANGFDHPMALEGKHEELGCGSCHSTARLLADECSACHRAPTDHLAGACDTCHAPSGWVESATYAVTRGAPIPHTFARTDDCVVCHHQAETNWPAPASHVAFRSEQCVLCHATGSGAPIAVNHDRIAALLEGKHASVDCVQCHQDGAFQGTAQTCYACHQDDDQHIGQFGQDCARCHTPNGWEGASTDHDRTAFALTGRHSAVACTRCHPNNTYQGTPTNCYVCHQDDDQHAGQLGQNCARCHTPSGWKGTSIDHSKTAFALTGRHSGVVCAQCHPKNTYQGTPTSCYACHQKDDRHAGQFGQDCARCHTPSDWKGASTDHSKTAFALIGRHSGVSCTQCHPNNTYKGTPTNCYTCHNGDDRHAGQFGQDCARCHTPNSWKGASIDHSKTAFALTGRHSGAACTQCHPNNTYKGTPTKCYTCHKKDDRHAGQFGQDCARCHAPSGWKGASIDHSKTAFALIGRHSGVACAQCHPNNTYKGTPTNCYACHQKDDRHTGQFGQDCASCHTPNGWKGASIDHNKTAFSLTGRHSEVSCAQCHPSNTYKSTPKSCYACHQGDDRHGGQYGQDCASCHTPSGWKGANFDHDQTSFALTGRHSGVACAQCHPNNTYKGTSRTCSACHGEPAFHAGVLGSDCAACHSPDGWRPARYDRSHPFPFSHGKPASCRTCHPDALSSYTCFACHEPGEIDEEHREEGIANYTNCVACHPTGREP